jgi:hypothetical protein
MRMMIPMRKRAVGILSATAIGVLFCAMSGAAQAQAWAWGEAPAPPAYSANEIRGQVVDEESGAPLEGVVVVARWEWGEFYSTLESHGYNYAGDVLHMAEALTNGNGRYVIPGWGPKSKAGGGRVSDHGDPQLSLFKSGYAPLQLRNARWTDYKRHNPASARNSEWSGKTLKLKKFTGAPHDYAGQIARFQANDAGGLGWRFASDNWRAMPRMIEALHAEKIRLGEDGAGVLGVNQLYGRSGQGVLRDAQSGKPVWPAVVNITWTLRRVDGAGTRRFVQQKRSGVEGGTATFYVSSWRLPAPQLPGWEVMHDRLPQVRIYAPGYRRLPDMQWEERGTALRMQKLPDTRDALLDELRAWRREIDAELAAGADREEALAGQRELLGQLSEQCGKLTADLHQGICFAPDSEVARYLDRVRQTPSITVETAEGTRVIKVVPVTSGGQQARGVAMPAISSGTVGGFSIEPGKPASAPNR